MAAVTRNAHGGAFLAIANPILIFLLSRGWGPKRDIMILHWTGRKSGRPYSTPVSRFDIDGRLFTTSPARWKNNFVGGHPAEVTIDGIRKPVTAVAVTEPAEVAAGVRSIIDDKGIGGTERAMGIAIEGDPGMAELSAFAASDRLYLIEISDVS